MSFQSETVNSRLDPHFEKMKMAVGYRNMAIHRYGDIDPNTTFIIMKKNYEDIEEFLKFIFKKYASDD